MRCPFSTLTLVNMTNGAFLPGWAKYSAKDIQIRKVSTHRMIYQTWKYLWWLWQHLHIESWKGRCKWLNAEWLLSFSPGKKKLQLLFQSINWEWQKKKMRHIEACRLTSHGSLGLLSDVLDAILGRMGRYIVSSSQEALNDSALTSCFGHCLTSHAIDVASDQGLLCVFGSANNLLLWELFLHYMPQVLPLSFDFLHCCLCFPNKVSLSSYIRFLFVKFSFICWTFRCLIASSTNNSNSVGSNFILHVCSYSTFIMVEKAAERKLLI